MTGKRPDELVRLHDIELDLLDRIRNDNNAVVDAAQPVQPTVDVETAFEQEDEITVPDAPIPIIEDVRPANPAQSIMDEIAALNPNP